MSTPLLTPAQIAIEDGITDAARKERARAANAERQRRYRERNRFDSPGNPAQKKRNISLWLSGEIDSNLQLLCIHHGCDRQTMLSILIGTAYDDMRASMSRKAMDALLDEADIRTRKHRALPK